MSTVTAAIARLRRMREAVLIRGTLQRGVAGSCDGVVDFDGDDIVAFADCTPNRANLIAAAVNALPELLAVVEAAESFAAMAPPWGHVDRERRLDAMRTALAAFAAKVGDET